MKHSFEIRYDNLLLRDISKNDLCLMRKWRNDRDNSIFLRKINFITRENQELWFDNYLCDESEIGFTIVETRDLKRAIGSVFLYNLNFLNKECEFGKFLIGDKNAHGKGLGSKATAMILEFGFKILKLQRIYASVNQKNMSAKNIYMKIGFQIIGSHEFHQYLDGYEDEIEIFPSILEKNIDYIRDILIIEKNYCN